MSLQFQPALLKFKFWDQGFIHSSLRMRHTSAGENNQADQSVADHSAVLHLRLLEWAAIIRQGGPAVQVFTAFLVVKNKMLLAHGPDRALAGERLWCQNSITEPLGSDWILPPRLLPWLDAPACRD